MSVFKKSILSTKNGEPIRKKTNYYYIRFKDVNGITKEEKAYKDKIASEQLKAKRIREVELAGIGIVDRFENDRKRRLLEHLEDFKNNLFSKGGTEQHAKQTYIGWAIR